jgi:hypothetical protein
MRILLTALIAFLFAAPAHAECNGAAEKNMIFSDPEKPDTFMVEAWGETCKSAHIVIYVKNGAGWFPLEIGDLTDFAMSDATPQTLNAALKDVAARIEGPQLSRLETWSEIQRAATQPSGEPRRATPLVQAEYERLLKSKPRFVYIPIGGPRAKLVVWDEHGERPVDFVYYGD